MARLRNLKVIYDGNDKTEAKAVDENELCLRLF